MPSHLTRQVFRRLLANEPIVHRGCLRRQRYSSHTRATQSPRALTDQNGLLLVQRDQRRSLFNFNIFRKHQDVKEANMDPGIDKMMELAKRQRMRARLPPPEEVAEAFRELFKAKKERQEALEDNQAQLTTQSLKYCLSVQSEIDAIGEDGRIVSQEDLMLAMEGMRFSPKRPKMLTAAHAELAEALYSATKSFEALNIRGRALHSYVYTLCHTGQTAKARDVVKEHETMANGAGMNIEAQELEDGEHDEEIDESQQPDHSDTLVTNNSSSVWFTVLRGFAAEGNEAELIQTLNVLRHYGLDGRTGVARSMLEFYLAGTDATSVKHWWNEMRQRQRQWQQQPRVIRVRSTPRQKQIEGEVQGNDVHKVLRWCLTHGELDFGHEIVKDLMTSNPSKDIWDAVFVWAAGTKKSVDEIDRMIDVMESSNQSASDPTTWRVPDIDTINGLVDFAISRDDPYMAERFITLGRDRNIEPNAKTFVLQMNYRLSVDDVDGALIAYKNLQSMDVSSNEDVPTVNRLIVALCKTNRHDFDTIMNVAADLSDRRVRFDSETVSTLSLLHLSRDEKHDVIDLLNTHAFHYSSTERDNIRKAFIDFCTDPKTPTASAWQTYGILKDIFDEMPRSERTELMNSFLKRKRADMAVRIFQNMRMHSRADTIPTIDTYVTAFMGLAKLKDLESVEVIHNLLKLDFNINVSTYLNNSLIIAYTACGEPRSALDFWEDIIASKEGPSYNSIHVALRACEKAAFGDLRAKDIWSMLRRRGVELDQSLWASYAAALVGNGDVELAISTLEEAEGKGEVEVDYFVLGSLYNAAQQQMKGVDVGEWAKQHYPEQWEKLESFGVEMDEEMDKEFKIKGLVRGFKIDRRVAP